MFERRKNMEKKVVDDVSDLMGEKVYRKVIKRNVSV